MQVRGWILGAAVAATLGLGAAAQAAIIATYNFNSSVNGATAAEDVVDSTATNVASGVTAGNLSYGAGLPFTASTSGPVNAGNPTDGIQVSNQTSTSNGPMNGVGGSYGLAINSTVTNTNEAGALSGDKYIGFTITPGVDPVSLGSLAFDLTYSNTGNGAASFMVYVGGTKIGNTLTVTRSSFSTSTFQTQSFDLSSVSPLTAPTEVRLYAFNSGGSSGRAARLDNITLNDAALVPEPASLGLLGLGVLGLLARRRA